MSAVECKFRCGQVDVTVARDEAAMGAMTAEAVVQTLHAKAAEGVPTALWLMAAPSAFAFYRALVATAERDPALCAILKRTHFFQFDDYPIGRHDPRFETTFRRLLEKHLYEPLASVCGPLPLVHPLELAGSAADRQVQAAYRDAILALRAQGVYFVQLKGIGMDGHWGFHGAETPLEGKPDMITVPMNPQNIRQQMLDWPGFFPTAAAVPRSACTFNVPMFLLADEVYDNVPQESKIYSVLAVYGTEAVIGEVPSSAIKRHRRARAYLTCASAAALLKWRAARQQAPGAFLDEPTLEALRALWRDPADPASEARNRQEMEHVLRTLGMIPASMPGD